MSDINEKIIEEIIVDNNGDYEPLIVVASSASELEPIAFSPLHPNDIIYYDVINNNTQKYSWACKADRGQIYRRITENGNDIPYDVRTIRFRRYKIDSLNVTNIWLSTKNYNIGDVIIYLDTINLTANIYIALKSNININPNDDDTFTWKYLCSRNEIDSYFGINKKIIITIDSESYTIPTIENDFKDFYTFDDGKENNILGSSMIFENKISPSYNNSGKQLLNNSVFLGRKINNNIISNNFNNNTIRNDFYENIISRYFISNLIGEYNINEIKNCFKNNKIDDNFQSNIIGKNLKNNIINSHFTNNIIGDNFENNITERFTNNIIFENDHGNDISLRVHDHSDNKNGGNIPIDSVSGLEDEIARLYSDIINKNETTLKFMKDTEQALNNTKENVSNKGIANGYASLDENIKIPITQIPDAILGQMTQAGSVDATNGLVTLTTNGKQILGANSNTITLTNNTAPITGYSANEGNYYIVSNAGTLFETEFKDGDWLIADSSGWSKISNTDAVTTVAGRIGDIILTKKDVGLENVQNVDTTDASKITKGILPIDRIDDNAISNAKMAKMDTNTIKGNNTSASANPKDLTAVEVRTLINASRKLIRGDCSIAIEQPAKTILATDYNYEIGDLILVRFTNGNTANVPTLNINSKGAKAIHVNKAVTSSTNKLSLAANDEVLFVYDGTQFQTIGILNKTMANLQKSATIVIGNSTSGHKLGEVDYLCTGTNDHTILNNAITALPSTGGKIIIREGTYNLGGSINVNKNNITLEGMDDSTVLKATTSITNVTSGIINLSGSNCKIKYLRLTNDSGINVDKGIFISGSYNTITGNTCSNSGDNNFSCGIYITGGNNNTITGNTCSNSGSSTSFGIYIYNGSNNTINSNNIANKRTTASTQSTSNTFAIYIGANCNYCSVIGNNLAGVTRPNGSTVNAGSAYTQNGTSGSVGPSTTPAINVNNSSVTIGTFNTNNTCTWGFNII